MTDDLRSSHPGGSNDMAVLNQIKGLSTMRKEHSLNTADLICLPWVVRSFMKPQRMTFQPVSHCV